VTVNGVTVTIIGVALPRFNGAVQSGENRRIWLPLSSWQLLDRVDPRAFTSPNARRFEAVARLAPGVSVANAVPAVRGVAARVDAEANREIRRTWSGTADVVRLRGLIDLTRYARERGPTSVAFTAIAVLILLVCTTTVSSLLVGGAVARRYEIGVRLALGASRTRIVRQMLTEIGILALAGGALGMWVFGALAKLIEAARDGFDVSPNWATTAFTFSYAVAAAMLAGLSPALHAARAGLAEVLKDSPTGATLKSRLQRTFVVAQIAIAQPLMVVLAAVTANVFSEIPALSNTSVRERLVIAEVDTRLNRTVNGSDRIPDLVLRLAGIPGVERVLPIGYGESGASLERSPSVAADSAPIVPVSADAFNVPPGYFAAFGVPILHGRDFVASDTLSAIMPVIVDRRLATLLLGSSTPVGRRIRWLSRADEPPTELEIVGIIDMENQNNTLEYPTDLATMFIPFRRRWEGRFLIRTSGPAEPLIPTILTTAAEEARMLPVVRIETLARFDRRTRNGRLQAFGAGTMCGMIVLVLASVGLYAMLSLALEQRRREIGIRVALGAAANDVVMMFFTRGMGVTMVGLAIGLPLSLAGLALVTHLNGMSWVHLPRSAAIVTLVVVAVASLASWVPARRAASVDPVLALRAE
jgi:predicted permease